MECQQTPMVDFSIERVKTKKEEDSIAKLSHLLKRDCGSASSAQC